MSLLSASMNRIRSRTAEKKLQYRFSHHTSMWIFSDAQGQLILVVGSSQIFELLQTLLHINITCKVRKGTDEKQPRKSGDTLFSFVITLFATMETSGLIWPYFKFIQALMYFIITCKYKKDPIKNSREKLETSVFFTISLWGFFQTFKDS